MTADDDVLSYDQAAKFLGVSRRTLERMVREGEVPSIPVRGRRTFSRERLAKWKQQNEVDAGSRRRKAKAAITSIVTA